MTGTASQKKRDWGMIVIGILLVISAFVIMLWPGMTLVTLAIVAGVMFLFAGGADLSQYFRVRTMTQGAGWILVNAILDIILGAMFIIHPIAAAQVLPWLAGMFVIFYGIMVIVASVGMRSMGSVWVLTLLNGILSIVIGILFFVNPAYFVWFLGFFLAWRGAMMCVYGFMCPKCLPYM